MSGDFLSNFISSTGSIFISPLTAGGYKSGLDLTSKGKNEFSKENYFLNRNFKTSCLLLLGLSCEELVNCFSRDQLCLFAYLPRQMKWMILTLHLLTGLLTGGPKRIFIYVRGEIIIIKQKNNNLLFCILQ